MRTKRTTPAEVFVPDPCVALDVERVADALWRDVDVPVSPQRGGGDEEHLLFADPCEEVVWDLVKE